MLGGDADKNLGTTLRKIIRRAGVEPWPKSFQNCRSSRQTDLEQKYPTYVVCAWLGNTPTIAHKHYLTVTDEHLATAAATGDQLGTQTPVSCRTDSHQRTHTIHAVQENASFSEVVGVLENARVAEEGLEPPTFSSGKTRAAQSGGAESGALGAGNAPGDPRLRAIIEAWPALPEATKSDILETIRAAGGED
jgi:hypothetical protein